MADMIWLYRFIDICTSVYTFLIMVRCIASWLPLRHLGPILTFVYEMTEPLLAPIRRLLGGSLLGLDVSPIVAVFVVELVRNILLKILF